MKRLLNFLFERRLNNFDIIWFAIMVSLFQYVGWYAFLLVIPGVIVGMTGEGKLKNIERKKENDTIRII